MLILEKDIEAYLKARVEGYLGKYIKLPAVYESGIPDRLVLLPGGRLAFVELKRPKGGKLSALQVYQIKRLRELGFTAEVVRNYKDADELLKRLMRGGDEDEV